VTSKSVHQVWEPAAVALAAPMDMHTATCTCAPSPTLEGSLAAHTVCKHRGCSLYARVLSYCDLRTLTLQHQVVFLMHPMSHAAGRSWLTCYRSWLLQAFSSGGGPRDDSCRGDCPLDKPLGGRSHLQSCVQQHGCMHGPACTLLMYRPTVCVIKSVGRHAVHHA
jgi:hypothetical protein